MFPRAITLSRFSKLPSRGRVLLILSDDRALEQMAHIFDFLQIFDYLALPAWDCLPYDRVSPHNRLIAKRLQVLGKLKQKQPKILMTSVNAMLQKTIPKNYLKQEILKQGVGLSARIAGK